MDAFDFDILGPIILFCVIFLFGVFIGRLAGPEFACVGNDTYLIHRDNAYLVQGLNRCGGK